MCSHRFPYDERRCCIKYKYCVVTTHPNPRFGVIPMPSIATLKPAMPVCKSCPECHGGLLQNPWGITELQNLIIIAGGIHANVIILVSSTRFHTNFIQIPMTMQVSSNFHPNLSYTTFMAMQGSSKFHPDFIQIPSNFNVHASFIQISCELHQIFMAIELSYKCHQHFIKPPWS